MLTTDTLLSSRCGHSVNQLSLDNLLSADAFSIGRCQWWT